MPTSKQKRLFIRPTAAVLVACVVFLVRGPWARAQCDPQELANVLAADGLANDLFGYSVAVSGDTAVVGAYQGDHAGINSGVAYVFVNTAGAWTQQAKLVASDAALDDFFGIFVAIAGDTIVVGATQDDDAGTGSGSAYVFTRSGTTWTQQAKLAPSDAAANDQFGTSVALSGDTAIIGAGLSGANDAGAAYAFLRTGSVWSQQQKLTASDAAASDFFGYSVAFSVDTAIVGARADDDNGTSSGSAYVFVRTGSVWSQQQKLTPSDPPATFDEFGYYVAVSGNTAFVGSHFDDNAGTNAGAAYVFTRAVGVWSLQAKLTASDAAAHDDFGFSIALSGDTALIGAWQDDDAATNAGSAYVFTRAAGLWTEKAKIIASDAALSDFFGFSVALSGDTAVIGADLDDDTASNAGSAYLFDLLPATNAGDIDGDHDVDLADIDILVNVLLDVNTNAVDVGRADVDCSGAPAGVDVQTFLDLLLN